MLEEIPDPPDYKITYDDGATISYDHNGIGIDDFDPTEYGDDYDTPQPSRRRRKVAVPRPPAPRYRRSRAPAAPLLLMCWSFRKRRLHKWPTATVAEISDVESIISID